MTTDVRLLVYSAILTWVMLIVASLWRTRSWTPTGRKLAFGNREDVPEPSPAAARADRAAKNMLENLVLFTALIVGAHLAPADQDTVDLGARVFFYARVTYALVYYAGIPYVRTMIWGVSVAGMGIIAFAALHSAQGL